MAVVAIFEITARFVGSDLNWDRAHIYKIPEISRRLNDTDSESVLFMGNSLTLHGVETDDVIDELKTRGISDVVVDRVIPVGTDVTDWIYIYRTFFSNVDQCPDVVVVGFVRHHMQDLKPPKRLRRLGRHFLSFANEMEIFSEDIQDFDDRAEVVLSQISACFGDQPLYNEGALYSLLPHYSYGEKRINHLLNKVHERIALRRLDGADPPPPTFRRVERLAKIFKDSGTHAIFVAMPLPEHWEMDPEVEKLVRDSGMTFIDARKVEGIETEDFPDGYHMGDRARGIFSRFIAGKIAEHLKSRNGE